MSTAFTNAQGEYEIDGLVPTTYRLVINAPGYEQQIITGVAVQLDQNTVVPPVDLVPEPDPPAPGSITGTVTDDDTAPIVGALVVTDPGAHSDMTDGSGQYELTDVPAGLYDVTASADGFEPDTITNVEVEEGQATSGVDFALVAEPPPSDFGVLAGVITDSSTTDPIEGAVVTATLEEDLFPTEFSVGITDPGWEPVQTINGGTTISTPDQTFEDVLFTGGGLVAVNAGGTTFRRCRFIDSRVRQGAVGPMLLEDCDFTSANPGTQNNPVVSFSNFTARRCKITDVGEGFRAEDWGTNDGPMLIEDCYMRGTAPPDPTDWHGDCVQAFTNSQPFTIRNCTLDLGIDDGTSSIFWPTGDGNSGLLTIERAILAGGSFVAYFGGSVMDSVTDLYIVEDSAAFGHLNTSGDAPDVFEAWLCTLDGNGQPIVGAPLAW